MKRYTYILLLLWLCGSLFAQVEPPTTVEWLDGEEQCFSPDYLSTTGASISGKVNTNGEYLLVGDQKYSSVLGGYSIQQSSYNRTFSNTSSSRPLVVIHYYVVHWGHKSMGEKVSFNFGGVTKDFSDTKTTIGLRTAVIEPNGSFNVQISTVGCGFGMHPSFVEFALGCLEKKIDAYFCEGSGSDAYLEVPDIYASYRWYTSDRTSQTISTTNSVYVKPIQLTGGHKVFCEAYSDGSTTPIVYESSTLNEYHCDPFDHKDTAYIYDTYTWRDKVYTQEGIYTDSLKNICHCDSLYTLVLKRPVDSLLIDTICYGTPYTWRGVDYFDDGEYSDTVHHTNDPDTIFRLQLSHWASYDHIPSEDGVSGIYLDDFSHADPDGLIRPGHNWYEPTSTSWVKRDTICYGEPYVWRGHTYTKRGSYADTLYTIHGCDSIFHLELEEWPHYTCVGTGDMGAIYLDTFAHSDPDGLVRPG